MEWGDGFTTAYGVGGMATHSYVSAASVTIAVDIVDPTGSYRGCGFLPMKIDSAPKVALSGAATASVGASYSLELSASA